MSTQNVGYETTAGRFKSLTLGDATRERAQALATQYWEIAAYAVLAVVAAVLRFTQLGERALHHDESLHAFYGWEFNEGLREFFTFNTSNVHGYHHVPFMHGPFQFIGNGFMMWIFGEGDAQSRILAAVMGTGLVLLPFLLRSHLGKVGALATAAFICFSPTLLYYSRFTREDIYAAFWTFGLAIFIWRYISAPATDKDAVPARLQSTAPDWAWTGLAAALAAAGGGFVLGLTIALQTHDAIWSWTFYALAMGGAAATLGFAWRVFNVRAWRVEREHYLFAAAAFMAFSFLTKETALISAASFLIFLDYLLAVDLATAIRTKSKGMEDWQFGMLVVAMLVAAPVIAITWPFTEQWRQRYDLRELPPEGLAMVVLGTLAVPYFAAFVQYVPQLLGDTEWIKRSQDAGNFHVNKDEATFAYAVTVLLIGTGATIGILLRPRVWAFAALAFYIPYVLLSTTFLSNFPAGFWSVSWGSWDYWLSQQDVARGDQPIYYYFITIPVYEFVPLILSVGAMFYYGIRGSAQRALILGAAALFILMLLAIPQDALDGKLDLKVLKAGIMHVWLPFGVALVLAMSLPMDRFTRFLIYWVLMISLTLTVASEKMPWLNVHIALALAVLAGKFVNDLLTKSDLRDDLPPLERLAPFFYAGVASALAIVVFLVVGPLNPWSFGGWALAGVAGVAVYWAFTGYSRQTAIQVAVIAVIAALGVFSVRAGVFASFGHPDNPHVVGDLATRDYGEVPSEILVYTQSSGDIPALRDEIARYSRETGLGYNVPIVIDSSDGYTWPWAWYLRDYKKIAYVELKKSDPANPFNAEPNAIVLANSNFAANVKLTGEYEGGRQYHHRRWFPEEYKVNGEGKPYTTKNFLDDITDLDTLAYWKDFWVDRRDNLPAVSPGTTDGVAFFPKAAGFSQAPVQATRTEGTQIILGGQGFSNGQLSAPSDVALDAQGNIYVADTDNHRIQKFDPAGKFIAAAGGIGDRTVSLKQPWSVAVAPDGTVYVADTWNYKVVKLDRDLNFVKEWGSGGQASDDNDFDPFGLFGPREIAVAANGNVLVVDTGNHRVVEYTPDGAFVRQFGKNGTSGDLAFNEPVGLATNAVGDMYLVDFWNKRVVVLDSELNEKQTIPVSGWGSQAVSDRAYIAVLGDGRILATDPTNGKILVFSAQGDQLAAYDVPKEGKFSAVRPIGIATDGTKVVVTDSLAHVVRVIPLTDVVQ